MQLEKNLTDSIVSILIFHCSICPKHSLNARGFEHLINLLTLAFYHNPCSILEH